MKVKPAPPATKPKTPPLPFSPGLTGAAKYSYIVLRTAHMLFSFTILPLCFLYLRQTNSYADFHGALLWFMVFGAVLWTMLYLMLSQFAYPATLTGAFLATAGLYLNGLASANLGDFNLYYAAYSTAWCALVAQSLVFSGILVALCLPSVRKKHLEGLPLWYIGFIAACATSLILFAWLLHRPFVAELLSESRLWMQVLFCIFFLWQTVSEMHTLYVSSSFNNGAASQSQQTWDLYNRYGGFASLGMILSLLASMVTATWEPGS